MMGAAAGTVAAAYPKTISANTVLVNNYNEDGGTRRSYSGAFPQFTDSPGATYSATTPGGYTPQFKLDATNIEVCGGMTHHLRLVIGGVATSVEINDNVNGSNSWSTGYVNVASPGSGTVQLQDGITGGSCSAHCQGVSVHYQFARS